MKAIRIISLIALLVTSFVAMDLILNVIGNAIPSINDGLGAWTILPIQLYFGDSLWSMERFFRGAVIASAVAFTVFAENLVLTAIVIMKRGK